ncbi:MAG: uridine monophosphate kinase [Ruminococcaceae bacterium]|nr:uridine monophosphate kinase [Oscillospiraceae bacterium]
MNAQKCAYKRVLLKLSGEALAEKKVIVKDGVEKEEVIEIFDSRKLQIISEAVKKALDMGVQMGIVIGAGNIWRGKLGVDVTRARADHMGMLATTINCLRFQDALEKVGVDAKVMTAIPMNGFTETFQFKNAIEYMENGKPVIFAGGIGIPFVSTDTATVVRACEIQADMILMAKSVDGVYDKNPSEHKDAKKYKKVSYDICLQKKLGATDITASALAEEQKIDSYIFDLKDPENIVRVVSGEEIGTLVTYEKIEEPIMY